MKVEGKKYKAESKELYTYTRRGRVKNKKLQIGHKAQANLQKIPSLTDARVHTSRDEFDEYVRSVVPLTGESMVAPADG